MDGGDTRCRQGPGETGSLSCWREVQPLGKCQAVSPGTKRDATRLSNSAPSAHPQANPASSVSPPPTAAGPPPTRWLST